MDHRALALRLLFLTALLALAAVPLAPVSSLARADEPPAEDEGGDEAQEPEDPTAFATQALKAVTLGPGQRTAQIVVFPLIAPAKPRPLPVLPGGRGDEVRIVEPEWHQRRYDVAVANTSLRPALLLGGEVLVGGEADRLLPTDVLVPGNSAVELRTLPAAAKSDQRDDPFPPFRLAPSIAPTYLRERAIFDPSHRLVLNFVSHFLEFRNAGDERHSLFALDESELLSRYCITCQRALEGFTGLADGRVVGFLTAVRGRVHSLDLFGTNELLHAYFNPILRGHTYAAAALALRAEDNGIPLPGAGDPQETLIAAREDAEEFLERLRDARYREADVPAGTIGDAVLVRRRGTQGRALGMAGRLVHMVAFPYDPFERALYASPLKPPPEPPEAAGDSPTELERRGQLGRLTEAERRLLDRLRGRR